MPYKIKCKTSDPKNPIPKKTISENTAAAAWRLVRRLHKLGVEMEITDPSGSVITVQELRAEAKPERTFKKPIIIGCTIGLILGLWRIDQPWRGEGIVANISFLIGSVLAGVVLAIVVAVFIELIRGVFSLIFRRDH